MIEIDRFEDVTRFKLSAEIDGMAPYWAAAYLVDGLLIDTGCAHTAHDLMAELTDLRIDRVVNTHFHEDHIGANRLIQERFGVPMLAHPDSVPLIAVRQELRPYQVMVWGAPEPSETTPIPAVVETDMHRFQVIETPGHSVGHVVLYEERQGWLFSGDIFAREKPKIIRSEEDIGLTLRSLRRLVALPSDRLVLFTATGRVIEDGRQALGECIAYLEGLVTAAGEKSAAGLTIDQMVDDLFGGEHLFASLTDGHFSTRNLVASLLKAAGVSERIRRPVDPETG